MTIPMRTTLRTKMNKAVRKLYTVFANKSHLEKWSLVTMQKVVHMNGFIMNVWVLTRRQKEHGTVPYARLKWRKSSNRLWFYLSIWWISFDLDRSLESSHKIAQSWSYYNFRSDASNVAFNRPEFILTFSRRLTQCNIWLFDRRNMNNLCILSLVDFRTCTLRRGKVTFIHD